MLLREHKGYTAVLTAVCVAACLGLASCTATRDRDRVIGSSGSSVVIRPATSATLADVGLKYLGSPGDAWRIAVFNREKPSGEDGYLALPLGPLRPGGLEVGGYQMVPVLMYHRLSEDRAERLTITRAMFEAQMDYLEQEGFTPISLDRLMDFMAFESDVPPKSVAITFDDGWCSVYTIAFPILKKHGFTATCFVYTDHIRTKTCLTWDNLREMASSGISVQSHSKTHRYMNRIDEDEAFDQYFNAMVTEIKDSRKAIEDEIGKPCMYFAYPFGKGNNLVVGLLKRYGYRAAFTAWQGSNAFYQDPFLIRRVNVYGDWNLDEFKTALETFHPRELK